MSWQAEMQAWAGDWASNGCYFATEQEAIDYGHELGNRAIMVFKDSRAVQSTEPVNYTFDWTNGAQSIK
jgi:hypothetical protein